MSEPKRSFMQELDEWVEGAVITPLIDGGEHEVQNGLTLEDTIAGVKKAIRAKVLESYKNGLKAGSRPLPASARKETKHAQAQAR